MVISDNGRQVFLDKIFLTQMNARISNTWTTCCGSTEMLSNCEILKSPQCLYSVQVQILNCIVFLFLISDYICLRKYDHANINDQMNKVSYTQKRFSYEGTCKLLEIHYVRYPINTEKERETLLSILKRSKVTSSF
jgi:hypothetical protein